jgi:putative ATP-dependent endonuclease of OLD family
MAKIVNLNIKNYRGIQNLSLDFERNQNLICLIGRGDSGKTTILEAISSVLSPNWNLNFSDTDFYNSDHTKNIEIVASVIDFPEKLLTDRKYGLNVRAFNTLSCEIVDDLAFEKMNEKVIPLLSVKLTVDSSLEPKWFISNTREQEDKPISATDRALLNCYFISDYVDKHFSWNKGNPLYSLLKLENPSEENESSNVVLQNLRKAKKEIDKNHFENLATATALIEAQAAELGLDISNTKTTLDARELSIKDGKISLHENSVPFRQKGKGSKRLASMAIQSVLVRNGGIMLIDEVEQGLEPDRIKQAVRSLAGHHAGQIFITTHSRDAITELGAKPLLFFLKDSITDVIKTRVFDLDNQELQKAVRACPEAFFSKKVIVCEGATEVGICRAMDKWRRTRDMPQMAFKDCSYVDGTGSTIVQRVEEINGAGLKTALFCDSDLKTINEKKEAWINGGISVFDCDDELCIEQQVFKDIPWNGLKELLQYAESENTNSFYSVFSGLKNTPIEKWIDETTTRAKIISEFKPKKNNESAGKNWFKALHHGEVLGGILFKYFDDFDRESGIKKILEGLLSWIDEGDK